ncbi:MAG: hypothetical protein V1736_02630 [Pseudomonadota bacterium]
MKAKNTLIAVLIIATWLYPISVTAGECKQTCTQSGSTTQSSKVISDKWSFTKDGKFWVHKNVVESIAGSQKGGQVYFACGEDSNIATGPEGNDWLTRPLTKGKWEDYRMKKAGDYWTLTIPEELKKYDHIEAGIARVHKDQITWAEIGAPGIRENVDYVEYETDRGTRSAIVFETRDNI